MGDSSGRVLLLLNGSGDRDGLGLALTAAGYEVARPQTASEVVGALDGGVEAVVAAGELDAAARSRIFEHDQRTARVPILFLTSGDEAETRALLVDGADCAPWPAAAGNVVLRLGRLLRARRASSAVRGIAHEMNNPLAVALTEVSFAAKGRGDEGARAEALVNAAESLQRMKGIVERMSRLFSASS